MTNELDSAAKSFQKKIDSVIKMLDKTCQQNNKKIALENLIAFQNTASGYFGQDLMNVVANNPDLELHQKDGELFVNENGREYSAELYINRDCQKITDSIVSDFRKKYRL